MLSAATLALFSAGWSGGAHVSVEHSRPASMDSVASEAAVPTDSKSTAALPGTGFLVVSLDGALIDSPSPTLQFEAKRAIGFGGCNRWNAGYRLNGEGLVFERVASTMRACEAAAMERERAFLDALSRVTRHDFSDSGELVLLAGDVPVIVARRQAAES